MEVKNHNIYLYPNNKQAKYYRLQIKSIRLQEYFSFNEYGNAKNALKAAIERRDFLFKMIHLREQLGYRKIFKQNNKLLGLNLYRSKRSRAVYMTLSIPDKTGKLKRFCERRLTVDNFEIIYQQLCSILLLENKVDLDFEDKKKLKSTVRLSYYYDFKALDETFDQPSTLVAAK